MTSQERAGRQVMRLLQKALALAPKAGLYLGITVTARANPNEPAKDETEVTG